MPVQPLKSGDLPHTDNITIPNSANGIGKDQRRDCSLATTSSKEKG